MRKLFIFTICLIFLSSICYAESKNEQWNDWALYFAEEFLANRSGKAFNLNNAEILNTRYFTYEGEVFYMEDLMPLLVQEADLVTFQALNFKDNYNTISDFAKDKNYVYKGNKVLTGIDPPTFTNVGRRYCKDKNYVYWILPDELEIVEGADVDSFETVYQEDRIDAKDRDSRFYLGKRVSLLQKNIRKIDDSLRKSYPLIPFILIGFIIYLVFAIKNKTYQDNLKHALSYILIYTLIFLPIFSFLLMPVESFNHLFSSSRGYDLFGRLSFYIESIILSIPFLGFLFLVRKSIWLVVFSLANMILLYWVFLLSAAIGSLG